MSGTMNDAKHPLWSLLRLVVVMTSLTLTLYINASNFDATEIRTIITMFLIAAGTEGLNRMFQKQESEIGNGPCSISCGIDGRAS